MIMMTRAILLASAPSPPPTAEALALALAPTWTSDLAWVGVGRRG